MSHSPLVPPGSESFDPARLRPPFLPRDAAERWLFGLHRLGIRPGLESVRELLHRMGDPQDQLDTVVVAGTNGKGTAATALAGLARASGLRTGLYTSPHLLDLRERIRVDGAMIPAPALHALVEEFRAEIDAAGTTFFESLTALTLQWFAREGVQLAILETGLGGRLDATNVVRKVGLVLTSIGLDHQELLGHSLEAIAREKLGLAEPGVPFYLAGLPAPLDTLALKVLGDAGAEAVWIADLPVVRGADPGDAAGRVQRMQFGEMWRVWQDLATRRGWSAPTGPVVADFTGRYDLRGSRPRLILDTAHNAPALKRVLEQFRTEGTRADRTIVFATVHGKEIGSALEPMIACASRILVCAPDWYRAMDPGEVSVRLRAVPGADRAQIEECTSVREALEQARAGGPTGRVLVTGSNFLVAEALDRLGVDSVDRPPHPGLWDTGAVLRRGDREVMQT